jgi:hypothetical protein
MAFFLHKASGTFGDGGFWSFGIQSSGSISEAAAETAWGTAIAAFFGDTNVKTYYSTATTLTATSTSTASATFHQTTKTVTSHSVAGTATDAQLSTRTSPVCSVYTANAVRYGRGRIFLPSPTYAVLGTGTTGELDATVAGHIATALTTMFGSLTTAGLTQILYTHKATRGGVPAYTTSQVVRRELQGKLRTQRRRSDKIIAATYTV